MRKSVSENSCQTNGSGMHLIPRKGPGTSITAYAQEEMVYRWIKGSPTREIARAFHEPRPGVESIIQQRVRERLFPNPPITERWVA